MKVVVADGPIELEGSADPVCDKGSLIDVTVPRLWLGHVDGLIILHWGREKVWKEIRDLTAIDKRWFEGNLHETHFSRVLA